MGVGVTIGYGASDSVGSLPSVKAAGLPCDSESPEHHLRFG
jgi:hypothetical protein